MEFKNVVFNAARDGKLRRLKLFLDHRSRSEVSLLVGARTNGATPLVMAAKNGHAACVEYLVDKCSADMEQVGSVVFDGETIDGAPPLWCAAAAGHLGVASFLLASGASVNATTKTNSTPLRAACFDGHVEIVKYLIDHNADIEIANRHGHTCLMIACYKGHYHIAKYLIEIGANVNRKSVKGNTALHDCAESGSLQIMKLLLNNEAKMDVDSYGMTPLLAASVTGHTHIVEYLITRYDLVQRKDRIDALELLGATYVDKKRDMLGALKFWKKAMADRYHDNVMIFTKPYQQSPIAAYENSVEVITQRQLDDLISDPDEMRMQALLVRERILGPAHPDTSYYIRYRGAVYADTGNFDRCITLWMYALEMQQKILEPLSPMTQSSFVSFAELFSFMMCEAKNRSRRVPAVNFCDIMRVFEKGLKEVEVGMAMVSKERPTSIAAAAVEREASYLHRTLVILLHLVCLLTRLQSALTDLQCHTLRCAVHKLVRFDPRGINRATPLHIACSREASSAVGRFPICTFPSYDVVNLLLEVGADPNAIDSRGNTALHTLAGNKLCCSKVVSSILEAGGHLDTRNDDGMTFKSMREIKGGKGGGGGQDFYKLVTPMPYTSLQCLAARVVRQEKIPYENILHPKLRQFVAMH